MVLASIQGASSISETIGDRLRERAEAAAHLALLDATRDGRDAVRERAFRSLIEQSEVFQVLSDRPGLARVLIAASLAGSTDREDTVRVEAARGLGVVVNRSAWPISEPEILRPGDREECLQALRRLLKDPSPEVRDTASHEMKSFATARGSADFEGKTAILADFRAALSGVDRHVRVVVAAALLTLAGGRDQVAADALLAVLADPEPTADRGFATSELLRHGLGGAAYKALARSGHFDRRDPLVLTDVLACLEELGPEAAPAVPTLEALLDDEDPGVRTGAGRVIVGIEDLQSPRWLAVSIKAVVDEGSPMDWRANSASSVLSADPAALSTAAGELMKQLTSEDPIVRRRAVELLSMIVDVVRPESPKPQSPETPGEGPS